MEERTVFRIKVGGVVGDDAVVSRQSQVVIGVGCEWEEDLVCQCLVSSRST